MSKGIGFAGLGKHLAERTLGLLKGNKLREADQKREDLRLTPDNRTDYNRLMRWQQMKRKRTQRIRTVILVSVLLVMLLTIVLIIFLTG